MKTEHLLKAKQFSKNNYLYSKHCYMGNIKLFESKQVRSHWHEEEEQWYFSVIDVVEILTNSQNPRDYWFKMKVRVKIEDGLELSTICRQLKLKLKEQTNHRYAIL